MSFIMLENSKYSPVVSIVVPVYNAGKYIRSTIDSVLAQSFQEWQLILVNDGSRDNSLNILKEYENSLPTKIKVIDKENSGVSDTRNMGIKLAHGRYIALLDADDQWLPDNLKLKVEYLQSNSEVDFVFSDMYEVNENLENPILAPVGKDENILEDLLLWNGEVIPGPCSNLVIRKECFEVGIHFKKKLSTIADQNLTVQLAFSFTGKRIPIPLWNYRVLPNSMSKSIPVMERDCLMTYEDYLKSGYFRTKKFRLKCYANMYLILAGSFWRHSKNKWRTFDYVLKSLFCNPLVIFKLKDKILIVRNLKRNLS